MDCMKTPESKGALAMPQEEESASKERVRVYYEPILSNLTIHIRCMFSLWEGLIDSLLSKHMGGSGSVESVDVSNKPSYWSECERRR